MPTDNDREVALLGLLHSVSRGGSRSQRHMASEINMALGLVNTYLKFCVRKGYVKVKRAPTRRYAYFLTPKGMAEKSRLTVAHLTHSLSFFRSARENSDRLFDEAEARGWRRIGLAGSGELAEIVFLCVDAHAPRLVGVIDPNAKRTSFRGLPVVSCAAALGNVDAVIVAEQDDPQGAYDRLRSEMDMERILVLEVLRISPGNRDTTQ
jgi:hypothetical protein